MGDGVKEFAIWGAPGLVGLASFLARSLVALVQKYVSDRFEAIYQRLHVLEEGHMERVERLARVEQIAEQTSEDVTRFAQALDRLVGGGK